MKWFFYVVLFFVGFTNVAWACPYTPLAWQREVPQHSIPGLVGQRKHLTWVRDQNHNFIDDIIDATPGKWGRVDVTIDLNGCLTPEQIEGIFSPFGRVAYIGRLITFIQLDQVDETDLPKLAELDQVAMVEHRELMFPTLDIASAATEAHRSLVFPGLSAEEQGLDGSGVTIAFIGTGVSDGTFTQLAGKRVAGYDATNPLDPGDGSTNPPDTTTHESVMAVLALGAPVPGQTCRTQNGAGILGNCGGIATGARYVNVRQCHLVNGATTCDGYQKAADWVGLNAKRFGIKVVNLSFSSCPDDDGTSAEAQQANYLVGMGLVVVASSSKNPSNCQPPGAVGDRIVRAPGSASFVLTINATNDGNSVSRVDDTSWSNFTVGPRRDFNLLIADPNALKPDLAAPGTNLEVFRSPGTAHITGIAGTSPAAGLASGVAALILQRYPSMTPDSVKALLIGSSDSSRNTRFSPATGAWDNALGWGLIRVGRALSDAAAQQTDVAFPNCAAAGSTAGQPCNLADQNPPWNNYSDITTTTSPRVNYQTTIVAQVTNRGTQPANATVNFGVMVFSAGNSQFHSIGSQRVTLMPGQTVPVSQDWTPQSTQHTCAQVSIAFGSDADYSNNMTQRNLQIAPSVFHMQVNNSLFVPAHFEVEAKSQRAGWACDVDLKSFDLDPFKECPRDVTIAFNAPRGTKIGDSAKCDVGVYAKPLAGGERQLVGGVTVVTYVPAPCKVYGQVVDGSGQPLAKADVALAPSQGEEHPDVKPQSTVADGDGMFTISTLPDVEQDLTIRSADGLSGTLTMRPACGPSLPRVVLGEGGLKLDYLPPVVITRASGSTRSSLSRLTQVAAVTMVSPASVPTQRRDYGCSMPSRVASGFIGLAVGAFTVMASRLRRRRRNQGAKRSTARRAT